MKRFRALSMCGLALLACAGLTSCSDEGKTCGTGTHADGNACVPDSTTTCGTGTTLMGGQCVPDGSVVCHQGTVFDPGTGTCVVDPTACADGTTLVNGTCVPDDELLMGSADHVEMAEPNDPGSAGVAGSFAAPAVGASTTFYGCVTARTDADGDGNLDADYDTWLVNATGPMVLEVTTDGIGGLSAGFVAVSADMANSPALDNWQRIGINLTSDTAKREIYLPAAGRYALLVTDARSLFLGDAGAGDAHTCYFATVKHVATPTAVALTTPQTTGNDDGHVKLYSYTATGTGDLLDTAINAVGPALSAAVVTLRGAALHRSAMPDSSTGAPAADSIGGLDNAEVVTLVVDAVYNYGATPQAFTIDSNAMHAQALPTTGGMITVTNANDGVAPLTLPEINLNYFDVAAAGLKRFQVTPSVATDMVILRRDVFNAAGALDVVATIDAFGGTGRAAFDGEFVKFLTPGRYYFATVNPAATMAGGTYTVTGTVGDQATAPLTFGTPATNQTLTNGNSFLTLDLTNPVWIEVGVTGTTDWGTGNTVGIEAYDLASEGWLRTGTAPGTIPTGNIYPVFNSTQPQAAPFAPAGRILLGDTRDFLVRTRPTGAGTVGAAPSYSMLVQNRPNVVNLGTITTGPALMQTITALADTSVPARFIATASSGVLRIVDHPTNALADIRLRRLNRNEGVVTTSDAATPGTDESMNARPGVAPDNFVAWAVDNKTAAQATDVTQTVTFVPPIPYTDICPTGVQLPAPFDGNGDDDYSAVQTLPAGFTFPYFGATAPTEFIIAANGFIALGNTNPTCSFGCYSNGALGTTTQPNNFIAPYWDDLDTVRVCRKDEATKVTIQWTGFRYNSTTAVQFQVVLNTSGQIDFIYGPGHMGDGGSATVGAENAAGTASVQVSRDTVGSVTPNSSFSFTTP